MSLTQRLNGTFCPPRPEIVRKHGLSDDCSFDQMSSTNKDLVVWALRDRETPKQYAGQPYYNIGAYPMFEYDHLPLGRTRLTYGSKNFAFNKKKSLAFAPEGTNVTGYSGFDQQFSKDLWTAQVLALWLTDGQAFSQFFEKAGYMDGIVSNNGHSPSNIAPLNIGSDGHAIVDLSSLFRQPPNTSINAYVMGPDGIYGPAAESIIAEWIRTGKLFGKSVPSGNAQIALNRLAQNISSPALTTAKAAKAQGNTRPNTSAAITPADQLSGAAQAAAGFAVTKFNENNPEVTKDLPKEADLLKASPGAGSDWLLIGSAVVGAAAVIGGIYYMKNKA